MSMNEADTRANLIDPKLASAGWGEVDGSLILREDPITQGRIQGGGKRASSLSSDYVLVYRGRKLASVEAKRESLSYTEGVAQAKDYAQRLQCRLAYATNGHDLYQIDMLTGEASLVDEFLSPKALWSLAFSPESGQPEPDFTPVWRERFAQIPFECKDVLAHVAYAAETHTRSERAATAKPAIAKAFGNYKQQEFIDFVLSKYVEEGVSELAQFKMKTLVELKYNTVSDAAQEFGSPLLIRDTFIGFQQYLYAAE